MSSDTAPVADDRTARARIRDAAIDCFAELGVAGTTARRVAAAAGVSPGLVMHHFTSMDGLRRACDEHVVAVIREGKQAAMAAGPGLDPLAAIRDAPMGNLARYLATMLVTGGDAATQLVDDLVDDAEAYLADGVASGMLRPTDDRRGRAVVLTLWSLGALALHDHVRRLTGVDLTDPELGQRDDVANWARPAWEVLGEGIFTDAFVARLATTDTRTT